MTRKFMSYKHPVNVYMLSSHKSSIDAPEKLNDVIQIDLKLLDIPDKGWYQHSFGVFRDKEGQLTA